MRINSQQLDNILQTVLENTGTDLTGYRRPTLSRRLAERLTCLELNPDQYLSICRAEPGHGTTFKLYLPRCVDVGAPAATAEAPSEPPRGSETVLLVEDEKSIRITVQIFLEDLGYTVLVAENPEEALNVAAEHDGEIDLLITDVIMPGMNGRDLANRLLELRPALEYLFISGFTADVIAQRGILDDSVRFLSKPFGRDTLARKLREVLDP
ncbi:MAG: response regulator [Verrucomicrobia bacterium]|jgi:two-component system, cell cycle sensor histidine kinase and response regulator CckA|nr:response regulator [Verrucomicrobiota bacterium]MBT7701194.1 response regulator [Verrucomicrobiota bacterium]